MATQGDVLAPFLLRAFMNTFYRVVVAAAILDRRYPGCNRDTRPYISLVKRHKGDCGLIM